MNASLLKFEDQGYIMIEQVFSHQRLSELEEYCIQMNDVEVGTRSLLCFDWVQGIANDLKTHPSITPFLPKAAKAIQCNYFVKDQESNWSVTLHRDLSIPVKSKISSLDWGAWSEKEGVMYAQPPQHVLQSLVVVRVHLENNTIDNGALELVAGSHKHLEKQGKRKCCTVSKNGVLLMKPLTLHASTKVKEGQRRVLHFVFGPENLPDQAQWHWSV